jgi:transcriptional regulator with XRE-family HTH domain
LILWLGLSECWLLLAGVGTGGPGRLRRLRKLPPPSPNCLHRYLPHGSMVNHESAKRKSQPVLRIAYADYASVGMAGLAREALETRVANESNPTLRRRELGFRLRQLRTDRGLGVDEVTERAMFSQTKLNRLETGRVGASARDIRDLCLVYGVTNQAEREQLMALAKEGKQRAWWQKLDLPYATYIGLETEATSIRDYNTDIVTGLLQIESYARAIFEAAEPPVGQAVIDKRLEARMKRQALLTREDGPAFHFILDEGALHRPVGGPTVMRAQLARLIEAANLPGVTFQLIPLSVGAHPALDSAFVVLEFNNPSVNDVVYVEGAVGDIYLESTADLDRYRKMFSRLAGIALNPEDSVALISSMPMKLHKRLAIGLSKAPKPNPPN